MGGINTDCIFLNILDMALITFLIVQYQLQLVAKTQTFLKLFTLHSQNVNSEVCFLLTCVEYSLVVGTQQEAGSLVDIK